MALNDGNNYFINAASGDVGFTSSCVITTPRGKFPARTRSSFAGTVPEPSTYALFGFGTLTLVVIAARRKKA